MCISVCRRGNQGIEGEGEKRGDDLLPATTGITGGKEYIISVKHVHSKRTIFEKSPTGPNQKGPCLMLSRPLINRQTTGMEYEIYSKTIQAVTMLLNAV